MSGTTAVLVHDLELDRSVVVRGGKAEDVAALAAIALERDPEAGYRLARGVEVLEPDARVGTEVVELELVAPRR